MYVHAPLLVLDNKKSFRILENLKTHIAFNDPSHLIKYILSIDFFGRYDMTFAENLVVPNAVWEFLNKSGQVISYASSHWIMAHLRAIVSVGVGEVYH